MLPRTGVVVETSTVTGVEGDLVVCVKESEASKQENISSLVIG